MTNTPELDKITLEGYAKVHGPLHVRRRVHDARLTGHVAATWAQSPRPQWTGTIIYLGEVIQVWGYSYYGERPTHWANDTY